MKGGKHENEKTDYPYVKGAAHYRSLARIIELTFRVQQHNNVYNHGHNHGSPNNNNE
jgi:hypothetical protein